MAKQNQKSSKFLTGALVGAMLGIAVGGFGGREKNTKNDKQKARHNTQIY